MKSELSNKYLFVFSFFADQTLLIDHHVIKIAKQVKMALSLQNICLIMLDNCCEAELAHKIRKRQKEAGHCV